jgi:hypothetical protein
MEILMNHKDFSEKNIRRLGIMELYRRQNFLKRELTNLHKGNEYLAHCRKAASPEQMKQNGPEWRSFQKANNLAIGQYTQFLRAVTNELSRRQVEHDVKQQQEASASFHDATDSAFDLKEKHPAFNFTINVSGPVDESATWK